MDIKKSACFTGHRTLSSDVEILAKRLYIVLEKLIINGVSDFYAGGAVGWDALASLIVLKLQKVYPHIKLHLILPCSPDEHGSRWSKVQQNKYEFIRAAADTIE